MPGPAQWDDAGGVSLLSEGFWFDGAFIEGGSVLPVGGWSAAGAPTVLKTFGADATQSFWLGGDAPLNLFPLAGEAQITLRDEADFWRIQEAAGFGRPVAVWWDWPVVDLWYVPAGPPAAPPPFVFQAWQTSRHLPWHLPGVSFATRPPAAFTDSTELTLDPSFPGAGEFTIPETGGAINALLTADLSGSGATLLKLRYHPELLVVIEQVAWTYRQHNELVAQLSFREILPGQSYIPAGEQLLTGGVGIFGGGL